MAGVWVKLEVMEQVGIQRQPELAEWGRPN